MSFFFLTSNSVAAGEILVAAASDLARAEQAIRIAYEKRGGHKVRFVLGSSGLLARQIRSGAPYDVYLSANQQYVDELAAGGHLLGGSVRAYALGRIALWSKSGTIRSVKDLTDASVLHVSMANPKHAPYGIAARQALEHRGIWEAVEPRVVYGENVRQALQYAESGNADVTITAWSLVFDAGGILLPGEWHAPIRQAGGVVQGSRNRQIAIDFLEFLSGPEGAGLLARFGFFRVP